MKIQLKVLVLEAANKRRSAKLVLYTENIAKACTLTLYKSSTELLPFQPLKIKLV